MPSNMGVGVGEAILSIFRSKAVREAVESIVIAFALAFLFKTFEAEAFVIPTGSMAPTLMGRHRDVKCPQCNFKYRVSASLEMDNETDELAGDVCAGTCPQCGFTACINPPLGAYVEKLVQRDRQHPVFNSSGPAACQETASRNGDRILVSKFAYEFAEPQRWNVFVFHFPGDAAKNYIKRLVGLPGETLRIYRGDVYTADYSDQVLNRVVPLNFHIERKPPDKVCSMKQLVYDNDFVVDAMTQKGWPTRWSSWPRDATPPGAWQSSDGTRSFAADGTAADPVWIRYQQFRPSFSDWDDLLQTDRLSDTARRQIKPELITDTYAYNSSVGISKRSSDEEGRMRLQFSDSTFLGMNWVRDLVLECDLTVDKPAGNVELELVAGGVPFRCKVDLATGLATLSIHATGTKYAFTGGSDDPGKKIALQRELTQQTPIRTPGTYRLRFANVDSQLHLWVNDTLIEFPMPATYGPLGNDIPQSDADHGLDLAPAGICSDKAAVRVNHMRLYRDVYYVAITYETHTGGPTMDYYEKDLPEWLVSSFPGRVEDDIIPHFEERRAQFLSTPDLWPRAFAKTREVILPLAKLPDSSKDQFLALGDNSPQSRDSRLWAWRPVQSGSGQRHRLGRPARMPQREYYVERELLIGKALITYWPLDHWGFVR
ncbi:MAG: signal peptidase I [Planctomycetia bacterium]|nr:signal peptidase I [Planctomycetia bacterium]